MQKFKFWHLAWGHFFNMATIQEETTMKKNYEKGTFVKVIQTRGMT